MTLPAFILEIERKFLRFAVPKLTLDAGKPAFQSLRRLPGRRIHDVYYDLPNRSLINSGTYVRRRNGMWEAKVRKGGDLTNTQFEEILGPQDVSQHIHKMLLQFQSQGNNTTSSRDSVESSSRRRPSRGQRRTGETRVANHSYGTLAAKVEEILGENGELPPFEERYGLTSIAEFTTTRENWLADDIFHIVLDTMDFGHSVGEVELQQTIQYEAATSTTVPDSSPRGLTPDEVEAKKKKESAVMDSRVAEFMDKYSWAFEKGEPMSKLSAFFALPEEEQRERTEKNKITL